MSPPEPHTVLTRSRRIIIGSSLFLGALIFTAVLATLIIRSNTAFSYFTRLEFCALCGLEQHYRETCILDQPLLRLTSQYENGVRKIFQSTKKDCGHNFHTLRERMSHYSIHRTPILIKRGFGEDYGADIISHPAYLAALSAIHSNNPQHSQLIWHKTIRRLVESHTNALDQLRANLACNDNASAQSFLTTNRYFRPIRPNPERWFYSQN